jgi:hypothetical protein
MPGVGCANLFAVARVCTRLTRNPKENAMLRGTRVLMGQEARAFTEAADRLRRRLHG